MTATHAPPTAPRPAPPTGVKRRRALLALLLIVGAVWSLTGLDITPEAVEAAIAINAATGMNDLVNIHLGTSTAMPFDDGSFDVVLVQHCAMQIEAKADLVAQCRRVLRKGGRLMFHDWFLGGNQPVIFPVPWAADEDTSFL